MTILATLIGKAVTSLFGSVAGKAFAAWSASNFGAFVVRAGLHLIASQIANALSSPPTRDDDGDGRRAERATSLDGNVLQAGAPLPRVLGSQRVFPPLLAEPLYYYDSGREVVEAVYGLAGPHDLEDLQINGAPFDTLSGVEVVTNDGTKRERQQRLLRRYGFTESIGSELTGPLVKSDGLTLDHPSGDIAQALPQAQTFRKNKRADEFWAQIAFQGGLHREADSADPVRVPFRVRIRPVDGEWRNLPEVHFRGRRYEIYRATIRLIWQTSAPVVEAATGDGFVQAFYTVPEQDGGSIGGWTADAEFDGGAGDDRMDANNVGSTRLTRMQMDTFEARFYLDPAEFAPGEWDIEITRGATIRDADFAAADYEYASEVRDFFGWLGTPAQIAQNTSGIQDACTLVRAVSVVNQTPTPSSDVAVIAIRARGVAIQRLSVLAHGLVRAWGDNLLSDGYAPSAWDASSGATVAADATVYLGRYNEAATVTSGGNTSDRADDLPSVSVGPGTYRCRALVIAGTSGSCLLRVADGATVRSVWYDLDEGTITGTSQVGSGETGEPYLREIAVGVYEVGFDLWVTSTRNVLVGVGPYSATAGETVTVLMGGLEQVWQPIQRSDNPADLFRDVLTTRRQAYPFAGSQIDEGRILDWQDRCRREEWKCRGVIEDTTLSEVLRIICGAGYARPDMLNLSVLQDWDRSAEEPVHIFTPRNSAGLQWQRGANDLPSGLRVRYRDADSVEQEVTVLDDGVLTPGRQLEQVEYESVQTEAEAVARAQYDLRSARHRRTIYSLTAPPSQIALLPGSLVGLVDDTLSDLMIAGSVVRITNEAIGVDASADAYYIVRAEVDTVFYGVVVTGALDSEYDSIGAPGWGDAATFADLGDLRRSGLVLEVLLQRSDGSWSSYVAQPYEGRTNMLLIDAPEDVLQHGAEAAILVHGQPERMVVAEIAPNTDLSAQIVLTPDASNEIWNPA